MRKLSGPWGGKGCGVINEPVGTLVWWAAAVCKELVGVKAGEPARGANSQRTLFASLRRLDFIPKAGVCVCVWFLSVEM